MECIKLSFYETSSSWSGIFVNVFFSLLFLYRVSKTYHLISCYPGLDGLLLVGLEGVHNFKELQELEFGRGFSYEHPLSVGIYDLPSIMLKEIVSLILK